MTRYEEGRRIDVANSPYHFLSQRKLVRIVSILGDTNRNVVYQ